jgi:hypothetical protein
VRSQPKTGAIARAGSPNRRCKMVAMICPGLSGQRICG